MAYGLNKGPELDGVLDARCRFDTAGDIHRPRPRDTHSLRHIVRSETARENQRLCQILRHQHPIEELAAAPSLAKPMAIQQQASSAGIVTQTRQRCRTRTHRNSLQVTAPELPTPGIVLVTVELQQLGLHRGNDVFHIGLLVIHEQGHGIDERRQRLTYRFRLGDRHAAFAARGKHQADRVCPESRGKQRIFYAGHAAAFDARHEATSIKRGSGKQTSAGKPQWTG